MSALTKTKIFFSSLLENRLVMFCVACSWYAAKNQSSIS